MKTVVAAAASSIAVLTFASPVFASGGGDIASAPLVAYGVQEFGNSAIDGPPTYKGCTYRHSWWGLSVLAGDHLTIDYEGGVAESFIYPVGTNDFNVDSTGAVMDTVPADNGKQEVRLEAPRTGLMPMDFESVDGCYVMNVNPSPGPYDFTARVIHGLALSIPFVKSVAHRGRVMVAVRTPDGGVISNPVLIVRVQMRRHSHWKTIGKAPVVNSFASVHTRISKRIKAKHITLRARATGPGYVTRTSSDRRVRLRNL